MRTSIIRISLIIIAVSLQASFINLALSRNLTLELLPLFVLAWVIIVGFEKIWPWIIVFGVFTDLVAFEKIGVNVIFFIGIAYAISFFSRRFLVERKAASLVVIILFVVVAFSFLDIGRILIAENFSAVDSYISIKESLFSWKRIVGQNILNILFFYVVYWPLNSIEKNIENYENKINVIS